MTTMIEKVAMAICAADGYPWDHAANEPTAGRPHEPFYMEHARAALQALMEPTEAMEDAVAGLDIYWSYRGDDTPGGPRDAWRAMLTAALEGK